MKIETKYDIGNTVLVERRWTDQSRYWDWNKEDWTKDGYNLVEGNIHEISIKDGNKVEYYVYFPKWYPDNFSSHECWLPENRITERAFHLKQDKLL